MPISLSGSLNLSGSLTTTGTITATTLVVQTITSSISSITGSTNFGSLSSDTHTFTGSLFVTGGLSVTSGSIGIGTINPVGMLDIQQSNITNMGISFMNTYGASGASGSTIDISSKLVGSGLTGQVGSMIRTGKEGDYSSGGARDAYMSFSTALNDNLNEAIRITSAGNVGIGTTTPVSLLNIHTGDFTIQKNAIGNSTEVGNINFRNDYMGAYTWAQIKGVNGANHDFSNITFSTTNGFNSLSEKVRITSEGYLRLAGAGIQFNGDTAAANALNDYEEGLVAITVTCSTSGTVTLDGGYNLLAYVKVGSIVHVTGLLYVNSVSSPVGSFSVPLPFAVANLADAAGTAAATCHIDNAVSANSSDFCAIVNETESVLRVYTGNTAVLLDNSAQQLKSTSSIYVSVTYRAS